MRKWEPFGIRMHSSGNVETDEIGDARNVAGCENISIVPFSILTRVGDRRRTL
jgi:hypothetical protein